MAVASWLQAFRDKSRRYAVPSAFVSADRAVPDAFQTRRELSPHPCGSSGGHARLSVILYASKRPNHIFCIGFWRYL
ncbi:hypothetical protein CS369_17435 [Candidatus Symbiopectobacterium sp. 'North America']|nr:hypothetical protein [Candidatus Symbiopectobacterium sp. 'North America']